MALPAHGPGRARWPQATGAPARSCREFPQHILEDAAVEEIFQFVDGIDAAAGEEGFGAAVGAGEFDLNLLTRAEAADAGNGEGFVALEAERFAGHAVRELERQDAHADQVR